MTENRNEKGQELARLRKEKGLTQDELGKLAGTTGKYISDLEHGKSGGIVVMARIAVTLGVPLGQIYRKQK